MYVNLRSKRKRNEAVFLIKVLLAKKRILYVKDCFSHL